MLNCFINVLNIAKQINMNGRRIVVSGISEGAMLTYPDDPKNSHVKTNALMQRSSNSREKNI